MLGLLLTGYLLAQGAPTPPKRFETRCGWIDNPTPGNFFLRDREGEWTLAEQGQYEARGMDNMPDLSGNEFVETSGPHGYACACLSVQVDRASKRVVEIARVTPKLLKVCLGDPKLPYMPK